MIPNDKYSKNEWKITSKNTKYFAKKCSQFLYESYILKQKWYPVKNNPIGLAIINKTNPLLIDDFTYKCNWIAIEKDNSIVGVLRYYCDIEESGFELEKFISLPKLITQRRRKTAEINRISISNNYKNSPALIILLVNLFYAFEAKNIKYAFGAVKKDSVLKLYKKLGFSDITDITNNMRKYFKKNALEIEQVNEFKCEKYLNYKNNIYHLLWIENIIHRNKLLQLYKKL